MTRTTYYGYESPGDADYDSASAAGIGDHDNQLSDSDDHHSVALTQSERLARFGTTGQSTGQLFEYNGAVYYDDDTAPESDRRVDIYSPSGPGASGDSDEASQALQEYEEQHMSPEEVRSKYDSFLPDYPAQPEEPAKEEEKPKEEPVQSPIDTFKTKFPALSKQSDDDIITKQLQPAFPDVPVDKLAVFARDPNGIKLLKQEELKPLPPLEKFKRSYPDFVKNKKDDEIEQWLYDNQAPKDTTFEQFKQRLNPPHPTTNALTSGAMESLQSTFSKIDRLPQTVADLYKLAGVYGWEQSASSWLKKNVPGYAGADDYFQQFAKNASDRAKQFNQQAQAAQKGTEGHPILGTVGEVAGGLPEAGLSFAAGAEGTLAALWGMGWEGTTAYGQAVEEHQKNALASAAESMSMRLFGQYLMNTGMGRVASGFANAATSAGEEEVQKWLRGEPNDITKDGKSFGVGLLTGLFMGGAHKAETPYRSPMGPSGDVGPHGPPDPIEWNLGEVGKPPEHLALPERRQFPVKAEDVIGTEEGYPEQPGQFTLGGSGITSEPRDETPVDPSLRGADFIDALEARDKRGLRFEQPEIGKPTEFVFHKNGAINEELKKAVDHHQNGDVDKAADHLDRAFSLMPNGEKQELIQKAIKKVDELGSTEPKKVTEEPKKPEPPKSDEDELFNRYFFSGVPLDPEDLDALMGEGLELLGRESPSKVAKDDLSATLQGMKFPKPGKLDDPFKDTLSGYQRRMDALNTEMAKYKALSSDEKLAHDIEKYKINDPESQKWLADFKAKQKGGEKFYGGVPVDPEDLDAIMGKVPELIGETKTSHEGAEFHAGLPVPKGVGEEARRYGANWRELFSPEKYGGEESERAAAIVKAEKGRTAGMRNIVQSEIARNAGIEAKIKGGTESANRERYFNKFSSEERRQQFIDYQEGRSLADKTADWVWDKVYRPLYEMVNKRDDKYHILYDTRDNYFYQLLTHPKDDLPHLLNDVAKSTGGGQSFVKPRQMTLVERFALGHKMLTDNPERLFQLRMAASDRMIEKIEAMRELTRQGLAYRADDPSIPYEAKSWPQEPTAEYAFDAKGEPTHKINYHVSPNIVPVINNAFDLRSVYKNGAIARGYFGFMNVLKGMGGIKLQYSLFHQFHIMQIAGADIASEAAQRLMRGVGNRGDFFNALTGWVPGMGIKHVAEGYLKMADEINCLKGRIPWNKLSEAQKENVKMFMDMGLSADVSHETQMMFGQFITDQLPKLIRDKWRDDPTGANMARMGYRTLSGEWFSKWWFGELTPRIKMAAAVMRRDTLKMTNPELFKPENRAELLKAYQKINRDIEGRYGEMNYDTLLWPQVAKQIGTTHLLALSWQVGLVRTTGDALIDLTNNTVHMKQIMEEAKRTKSSKSAALLSNRLLFGLNYNAVQLVTGAAITYMIGRSIPTWWDMVFPRVGKDDKGRDKRVQMQGFMKEWPAINEYAKESGWPGAITKWALNKINPGIAAAGQVLYNKDYMGKLIGNLMDNLAYWAKETFLPISVTNIQKSAQGGGSTGDYIMDVLGFTPSGRWTLRSDTGNKIIQAYLGNRDRPPDIMDARDAYQRAYNSGNAEEIRKARGNLDQVYQKEYHDKPSDRIIKGLEHDSHLSSEQKIFSHLRKEQQIEFLKKMSPEERKTYLPNASKKVREEFGQ